MTNATTSNASTEAAMIRSKSHSNEKINSAMVSGAQVWQLDTDGAGEDDVLIGTYDEAESAVLHHHELPILPERWSIDRFYY